MGMFDFLKNKIQGVNGEVKKVVNRDLMEAIVGGSLLVAAADGEISDDELMALDSLLSSNPALEEFGPEIGKSINRFEKLLNSGFRIGKMKIMREIMDIKDNAEHAEEVFVNMLTIAESDGNVDEGELAVLREVAGKLNLSLKDYGL